MKSIAVIGAGVIGGAIVKSLLKGGYSGKIYATRREIEKLEKLKALSVIVTNDNKKAATSSEVILICVKPNDVTKVLNEIRQEMEGKLVISTVATLPLIFYKQLVPKARFVRTMPNVSVLVQEAFTAYCYDEDITTEDKKKVTKILDFMGISEEVDEKYMDAITALSGSGPGYISIIIEALMYAGLRVGLPRTLALYSSAQTVLGTGKLILKTGEHPAKIKDMVTTPGGTTIEALFELEGSQIRQSLMKAVSVATKKGQEIRDKLYQN